MMKAMNRFCIGTWLVYLMAINSPAHAATTWQQTGGPAGGSINCLAFDPTDHQIVYAGTLGGAYKSTDGGATWSAINNGLPNYTYVYALAIEPSDRLTIYAGTGYNGVYRSSDGGASWSPFNNGLSASERISSLVIVQNTSRTIYIGTRDNGVYKYIDATGSWSGVNDGLPSNKHVMAMAIDPANPQAIYAGLNINGMFRLDLTTESGSWEDVNNNIPSRYVDSIAVRQSTVYAGTDLGAYKSVNGGDSWSDANSGLPQYSSVPSLAIDPASPLVVYAGTNGGVYKSTDGGDTWEPINSGMAASYVSSLTIDPGSHTTVYAGTSGNGLFKSTNGGSSWSASNSGMISTYILSLAVDPSHTQTVYAGTSGNGLFKSTNSCDSWNLINSGPISGYPYVSALVIDPVSNQTIYAGTWNGGVFKSTDGGGSWSEFSTGLPVNKSISVLRIDPTANQNIIAGTTTSGVYISTGGGSWSAMNNGLGNTYINALVIAPTNPLTLYAGTNGGGVFISTDGGGSWVEFNNGLNSYKYVYSLAIDPTDHQTLYAATIGGGVFKSTAGGDWIAVNNGMDNHYADALAIGNTDPLSIFAGTRGGGVYKSTDGGGTWSAVNSGLGSGYGFISQLATDPITPQIIYAGTTATGVFRGVSDPMAPGVPRNVQAVAGNGQDTVSFTPPLTNGGSTINSYTVTADPGGISATASTSPITVTGLDNNVAYTFSVSATNGIGTGSAAPAAINLYGLGIILDGSGSGSVRDLSSGKVCPDDGCLFNVNAGDTINLAETSSNGSRFSGWGLPCSGTGGCGVLLGSLYKTITATFDTLPNVRIFNKPKTYGLIQSAYNDSVSGDTIQARAIQFEESLSLDNGRDVVLKGGYDAEFLAQGENTILQGSLTVVNGSIIIERFSIR